MQSVFLRKNNSFLDTFESLLSYGFLISYSALTEFNERRILVFTCLFQALAL